MKRTLRILGMGVLLVAGFDQATGSWKQTSATPVSRPEMAVEAKIDNFSFSPAVLEIKAGTTVTWTNADDIPHTVVSNDQVFKSKVLDTDQKFSFTFDKPGTYPYFCSLHPKMTAKVVVQ
jgi:plastocyanin